MKNATAVHKYVLMFLALLAISAYTVDLDARPPESKKQLSIREPSAEPVRAAGELFKLPAGATILAEFTFDSGGSCVDGGWVSVDKTAQLDEYFHVDDFAGLGDGDFGRLTPLSGDQSLWCGQRPDAGALYCAYAALPGYGNYWDQTFESIAFATEGNVSVTFTARYDSEPDYDFTYFDYLSKTGTWRELCAFNGVGDSTVTALIPADSVDGTTKLRFVFCSDVAYSDEDGVYDSDGAVIIDDLMVTDGTGIVSAQDFEAEAVGDKETADGHWEAKIPVPYGDYADLYPGTTFTDPSSANPTCFWGFFSGSTYDYECGGYPGTPAVPYEAAWDSRCSVMTSYIANEIWSPEIPFTGNGSGVFLQFDVYHDLAINSLVFYQWKARFYADGCWSRWVSDVYVYYGTGQIWVGKQFEIGQYCPVPLTSVTQIQIALGVRDMCGEWRGQWGDCSCHSNAPLFDNVRVYRGDVGHVAGKVYRDVDGDCAYDEGIDIPISYRMIELTPGPITGFTNSNGDFLLTVVEGAYTVAPAIPLSPWKIQTGCSPSYAVSVVGGSTEDDNDFALTPEAEDQCEVQVQIVSRGINSGSPPCDMHTLTSPCPGIEHEYLFVVRNQPSSTLPVAVSSLVNLVLDPTFVINSVFSKDPTIFPITDVTPSPVPDNERTIRIDAVIGFGQVCRIGVRATPGGEGPYTTQMNFSDGDQCTGVKTASMTEVTMCSCDPNDKLVTPSGCGPNGNIAGDEPLVYRIRFENVGPGAAHNVSIEDQLDDDVDESTVTLLDASHAVTGTQIEPGNVLRINFDGIELPGTYYPDDNKGYVVFSVEPDPDLDDGTTIENTAEITFDFNTPVVTNTTVNTIRAVPSPMAAFALVDSCVGSSRYYYFTYTGGTPDSASYLWEFGPDAEPSSSTEQDPEIVRFSSLGEKTVSLTVARFGCVDNVTDTVEATECGPTAAEPELVRKFALYPNHPNPFNPTTTIPYETDCAGRVTLAIYDVSGNLVRTLVDREMGPGSYNEKWDGRDSGGTLVASGVYLYRLTAGSRTLMRKAVLLK